MRLWVVRCYKSTTSELQSPVPRRVSQTGIVLASHIVTFCSIVQHRHFAAVCLVKYIPIL